MRRKIDQELKAGIFVIVGLVLILTMMFLVGGSGSIFRRNFIIYVQVPDAMGLLKGAMIRSGGLRIGRVSTIDFSQDFSSVRVSMLIEEEFRPRIRKDAIVRFQTQGVLGDKYIEIINGSLDSPIVEAESTLEIDSTKDLSAMLTDSQQVIQLLKDNLYNIKQISGAFLQNRQNERFFKDLSDTTNNLKDITHQLKQSNTINDLGQTVKNLRVVSERIKNGDGTVGALLSDSSLYEDLKSLIGGANRNNVLKFFVRQAVKSSDNATKEDQEKGEKTVK